VNRDFTSFPIADLQQTKMQMLNWANQFNICCFLDNHGYDLSPHSVECLLAADPVRQLTTSAGNAFEQVSAFYHSAPDWIFGHFGYDLKNETESLSSAHPDYTGFPDLYFFVPRILIQLGITEMSISCYDADARAVFDSIMQTEPLLVPARQSEPVIKQRFEKEEYLDIIEKLKQHILRGDCYEINFCQEFYAENVELSPLEIYYSLSKQSPNPLSAFYRLDDRYLICASPERYLRKKGTELISQPIKGTSQRDRNNSANDRLSREALLASLKDRSENVMVVDLVRNDLSRICEEGTVSVEELFGVYSFPQVHQMISTVKGRVKEGTDWTAIIKASFPMGSMTGAPKKRVLELIEKYERSRRGIFSGALGYVTPGSDFDFNVVIRSILYNSSKKYLSFSAGSGITFYSDPLAEYEECLIKVAAIRKVLAAQKT
jgi:para-aminobenzoate synthetase component 1